MSGALLSTFHAVYIIYKASTVIVSIEAEGTESQRAQIGCQGSHVTDILTQVVWLKDPLHQYC